VACNGSSKCTLSKLLHALEIMMAENNSDEGRDGRPRTPAASNPKLVTCIQRVVAEAMRTYSVDSAMAPARSAPLAGSGTGIGGCPGIGIG